MEHYVKSGSRKTQKLKLSLTLLFHNFTHVFDYSKSYQIGRMKRQGLKEDLGSNSTIYSTPKNKNKK